MRLKKSLLISAIALTGVLALSACTNSAAPEAEVTPEAEVSFDEGTTMAALNEAGTITIGTKFDQPLFGLAGPTGDPEGFDVEIGKLIAAKLGIAADKIEWVETQSKNREPYLQSGQVDLVIATYSITDKRKEVVSFAGPYFVAGQDLLVAADDDSISGPEDLEGKNLCSVTGSTSAQRIKDEYAAGTNLLEQPGYAECVTALTAGTVDAVTTDDIILAGLAAVPANEGKVKVVGNPFSEENYGVGIAKDSEDCEAINEAITKMIDDGTWQELLDKNVGASGYKANEELNPPTPAACA